MEKNKQQIIVQLDSSDKEKLKNYAKTKDLSISQVIRQFIKTINPPNYATEN
jgi:hypothetical protein